MKETKIAVIGLGYVGLPLARLFSTKFQTIGYDLNQRRVKALMEGHDATMEVADELLQEAINTHGFKCTSDIEDIKDCNFYVVAVPTPVEQFLLQRSARLEINGNYQKRFVISVVILGITVLLKMLVSAARSSAPSTTAMMILTPSEM